MGSHTTQAAKAWSTTLVTLFLTHSMRLLLNTVPFLTQKHAPSCLIRVLFPTHNMRPLSSIEFYFLYEKENAYLLVLILALPVCPSQALVS